ncbi:hypothetical protein DICVIV_07764 [Dictyocaulus viviparus]|uniref:Uncharacterized protein n=1 Tax=Dictyocaulus viviparus TaxID=29172 RepID=A0A0D8XNC7_DICVI|nr:hypothetical protein DICVIV_07764 [Dictyocaulus viviparus]
MYWIMVFIVFAVVISVIIVFYFTLRTHRKAEKSLNVDDASEINTTKNANKVDQTSSCRDVVVPDKLEIDSSNVWKCSNENRTESKIEEGPIGDVSYQDEENIISSDTQYSHTNTNRDTFSITNETMDITQQSTDEIISISTLEKSQNTTLSAKKFDDLYYKQNDVTIPEYSIVDTYRSRIVVPVSVTPTTLTGTGSSASHQSTISSVSQSQRHDNLARSTVHSFMNNDVGNTPLPHHHSLWSQSTENGTSEWLHTESE